VSAVNPFSRVPRREDAQHRFIADVLRGAIGPLPWLGRISRVHAVDRDSSAADPPVFTLLMRPRTDDGPAASPLLSLHLDRWDLLAIGVTDPFVRTASAEALQSLLARQVEALRANLEELAGVPVDLRLEGPSRHWPGPGMAAVTLHARGDLPWLRIGVSTHWAELLRQRSSGPLTPACGAWPLTLTLAVRVAGPQPSTLDVGDLWRLPSVAGTTWAAQLLAGADLRPIRRATLQLDPTMNLVWSVMPMNDDSPAGPGEPDLLPDLPVAIEIHLPHRAMRLRELTALTPGALVDLGCTAEDVELTLLSAGSAFAHGRFVHAGSHLGVEITRILWGES
jgi:flagellar motor switch/type III secretory pathway protein FliN